RDFHVTGVQTCALPISLSDHVLELGAGEPRVYGGGYTEYVAQSGHEEAEAERAEAGVDQQHGGVLLEVHPLHHGEDEAQRDGDEIGRASCREGVWISVE